MGLKIDIQNKVKNISKEKFEVQEVNYVPNIDDSKLTFNCTGLKFNATVLYIDMRGSTAILNKHNKRTVAKLHMSYYHAIVKIAKSTGGKIRSFNGDSLLVFYQGNTKDSLSNAVKAAMQMRYAITELINEELKAYSDINFGIGIDHGEVLVTKVGLGGDGDNKDLIWIGNAVNKSTVISDKCSNPNYIGISRIVYDNLEEYVKYHEKDNGYFGKQKVDMWSHVNIDYNSNWESAYTTSYYWTFD